MNSKIYYYSLKNGVTGCFSLGAVSIKINNIRICFCSIDLSCTIIEKDNFIVNLYILLACHIK